MLSAKFVQFFKAKNMDWERLMDKINYHSILEKWTDDHMIVFFTSKKRLMTRNTGCTLLTGFRNQRRSLSRISMGIQFAQVEEFKQLQNC